MSALMVIITSLVISLIVTGLGCGFLYIWLISEFDIHRMKEIAHLTKIGGFDPDEDDYDEDEDNEEE